MFYVNFISKRLGAGGQEGETMKPRADVSGIKEICPLSEFSREGSSKGGHEIKKVTKLREKSDGENF